MSTTLSPSRSIADISDRAMLVGLKISQFNPVKTDKKITAEVATKHGSEVSMGRYAKSVINKTAVEKLRKKAAEVREEHYRRTLPWAEDGARILTSDGYNAYAAYMRDAEGEWNALVAQFMDTWDETVESARVLLNGLFNPDDYPPKSKVASKFSFRCSVRPVPMAEDFRVVLGANEVSVIKAGIRDELQDTVNTAMQHVWGQMREVVSKMVERLKAYNPQKPAESPFRDTLVTNISDLLDVLPTLNLTKDPTMDRFVFEMRELVKHDPQKLRDDIFAREDTAKRAEQILSQMSDFIA